MDAPVGVNLGGVSVVLFDISEMGAAVLVPSEAEERLLTQRDLPLLLSLPGESKTIRLVATIMHRRLSGAAVMYGLEYNQAATQSFRDKEARIHEYVMARQRQDLVERRERKAS